MIKNVRLSEQKLKAKIICRKAGAKRLNIKNLNLKGVSDKTW